MRFKTFIIFLDVLFFVACSPNKAKSDEEVCKATAIEKTSLNETIKPKKEQQFPRITFNLKEGSTFFKPGLKDSGLYALKVAAAVLNSQEFRDSISKYVFPCKNHGHHCKSKCDNCKVGNISTKEIFDSLYRQTNVALQLELKGCGEGTYGETIENSFLISSCYYTVYDDKNIPFTYCYAYHICHEYMHNVGFFHFEKARKRNRDTDIAEKTGWIAYEILLRWYEEGIKPF